MSRNYVDPDYIIHHQELLFIVFALIKLYYFQGIINVIIHVQIANIRVEYNISTYLIMHAVICQVLWLVGRSNINFQFTGMCAQK